MISSRERHRLFYFSGKESTYFGSIHGFDLFKAGKFRVNYTTSFEVLNSVPCAEIVVSVSHKKKIIHPTLNYRASSRQSKALSHVTKLPLNQ